jgi:hypothetical protein
LTSKLDLNKIIILFLAHTGLQPFWQLKNNALKTTYDFYAFSFSRGSIKVTTGFQIRDIGHNTFFSRLTLRVPVSTQKKSVVTALDNVEK